MIKVFAGYDDRMPLLHSVLTHSIVSNSSKPVSVSPLYLKNLGDLYKREVDPNQSTQFSFSRFLVPYLCDYKGWAIFMDNDVVCLSDINDLWGLQDDKYAVMCVKHNYEVMEDTKFLGEKQTKYEKKNWSSLMLLNCAKCTALTPEYVNTATGLQLHQFKWLESEDLIGEVPKEWNYLAGYYPENEDVSLVHYTDGGPYFDAYKDCDFAKQWLDAREAAYYMQTK